MTDKTQEPVAWINWCAATGKRSVSFECESELASQPLYEGITQNTQYHYSKFHSWFDSELHRQKYTKDHPAYLAAQEAWNAANDAAQHRINRLNAEIEAWKVRFKIAEDALAKLNGPEQEPVAWMTITPYGQEDDIWYENPKGELLEGWTYKPLYTSPQPAQQQEPFGYFKPEPFGWTDCAETDEGAIALYERPQPAQPSKPWVGLTDVDRAEVQYEAHKKKLTPLEFMELHETKLREKNA